MQVVLLLACLFTYFFQLLIFYLSGYLSTWAETLNVMALGMMGYLEEQDVKVMPSFAMHFMGLSMVIFGH
jgi:hypothetical protein